MKIYNLVEKLLKTIPATRNSDKLLFTEVYRYLGAIKQVSWFGDKEAVLLTSLLSGDLPSWETISRCRRKLQELKPDLGATSSQVIRVRHQKQDTKGTFIFREEI